MRGISNQQLNALRVMTAVFGSGPSANQLSVQIASGPGMPLAGKGSVGQEAAVVRIYAFPSAAVSIAGFALTTASPGAQARALAVVAGAQNVGAAHGVAVMGPTGSAVLSIASAATNCPMDVWAECGSDCQYVGNIVA